MEGGRLIKGKMEALSTIVIQLGGAVRAGFSSIDQCDRLRAPSRYCVIMLIVPSLYFFLVLILNFL
jgi:hypothetical protein